LNQPGAVRIPCAFKSGPFRIHTSNANTDFSRARGREADSIPARLCYCLAMGGWGSAIDWVLDQHKEKKPRDPTVAAKFNTYRFADYKESMIELLAKVVRVSIDTVAITQAMRALDRSAWE
jgi:hypothetical protein